MGKSTKSPSRERASTTKKKPVAHRKSNEGKVQAPSRRTTKRKDAKSMTTKPPKTTDVKRDQGGITALSRDEIWSKSKKKRMRHKMAGLSRNKKGQDPGLQLVDSSTKQQPISALQDTKNQDESSGDRGNASSLQKSFKARLTGSRFRELNEDLYTSTSIQAFAKFSSQPELYEQYHEGFRHQVEAWPINPVNVIVKWLVSLYSARECVVADFGCGDAALAKKLLAIQRNGTCPFTVHSFDLVACCDLVTACDMAKVPLQNNSVNVAIFCLSLMGTNLADFIREAHRVLQPDGILKIAEVRSRFESKKDELEDFIHVVKKLGFNCTRQDKSNKMFVMLELRKNGKRPDEELTYTARPCIYKRR